LPDLAKNAHKDWNFYPQKNEDLFTDDPLLNAILMGWKRHLKVDILFHSSDFFSRHTANLKQVILPILLDSPVRPSFLAHIGVELLLDHLLIEDRKVDINAFYTHLNNVDEQALTNFIEKCGGTEHFFKFLSSFRSSRYLLSYQKLENISYALQRICMRLWTHPFHEETVMQLTEKLSFYKEELAKDYLTIFEEIEINLKD